MDRHNPHNSYKYHPSYNAAPIYIPPSKGTQRILPVPQKKGQGDYDYGMPGQASPVYVPPSKHSSMSDEHSKKQIERLSQQNDSLTKALSGATGAPSGSMPTENYPRIPSYTRVGVRSGETEQQFADRNPEEFDAWADSEGWSGSPNSPERAFREAPNSPSNVVAAQNTGIQAMQPPQLPPQAPQGPSPFSFDRSPVDLSALDEAYRRRDTTPGT